MEKILEVRGITKYFPGVKAVDNVDLDVYKGEVHAIVGENGAGKSTLMKILGGLYKEDSGTIAINGKNININSVQDSINCGISVIYQEFNLLAHLTVAENVYLSKLPGKAGIINKRQLKKNCSELFESLEISMDVDTLVSELSVSEMQMVEIVRAISYNSHIIIMDEPTAALNSKEVATLYRLIRMLKERNKTIIYISHRLKELFDLSDRITVMRDGAKIATVNTADITEEQLVRMMVGRDIKNYYHMDDEHDINRVHEDKLKVVNLCKEGYYDKVNFRLGKGEILGVAGLMGCRREEIAKTLIGAIHPDSGYIEIDGKRVHIRNPWHAISQGIAFVTDDRKNEGILPRMGVLENLTISVLNQIAAGGNGLIHIEREDEIFQKYSNYMELKYTSPSQHIVNLSGGNQQKVLLSRSLATGCKILILMEPTRGIDVGTKSEIYKLLLNLAQQGLSILLVTSEMNELLTVCHRVIVVHQGTITGELIKDPKSPAAISEDNIMFCATGNKRIFYQEVQA